MGLGNTHFTGLFFSLWQYQKDNRASAKPKNSRTLPEKFGLGQKGGGMSNVELRELLEAAETAGDLRRKETLRLIEYVEKVLFEVVKTAEKSGTTAEVRVEVEGWEDTQLLAVRPLEGVRKVWAAVLENEYNGKVFCLMAAKPEGVILHDVPRRAWIAVAKNIGDLVQRLKVNAERDMRLTKEAADLAERMALALGVR